MAFKQPYSMEDKLANSVIEEVSDQLKSAGHFERMQTQCLSLAQDSAPFRQLQRQVEASVRNFLSRLTWRSDLSKGALRDELRAELMRNHVLHNRVQQMCDSVVQSEEIQGELYYVVESLVNDCAAYNEMNAVTAGCSAGVKVEEQYVDGSVLDNVDCGYPSVPAYNDPSVYYAATPMEARATPFAFPPRHPLASFARPPSFYGMPYQQRYTTAAYGASAANFSRYQQRSSDQSRSFGHKPKTGYSVQQYGVVPRRARGGRRTVPY